MTNLQVFIGLATAFGLGPLIGIQTQKWIERARERSTAQQWVFNTLMATRATRVDPQHVQALNMIDLLFTPTRWRRQTSREKEVIRCWREYAEHLDFDVKRASDHAVSVWSAKSYDLFIELLFALSQARGYGFDKPQLKRGIYYPEAFDDAHRKRVTMEDAFIGVLTGATPLTMKITELPVTPEAYELQMALQEALLALIRHGVIPIKNADEDAKSPHAAPTKRAG